MIELKFDILLSSPRLRGCFSKDAHALLPAQEFPAVAGVFPRSATLRRWPGGVPRGCGGVSVVVARPNVGTASSPRLRGCFLGISVKNADGSEFPAVAGVFPGSRSETMTTLRVPRGCGGVSSSTNKTAEGIESSPRLRGCFFVR